ncbi:MAG TPA: LuxR C-terminal-related transcriptional regulator [Candidatus Methylomirabilis sp.]|nr:LuxR C-terminal-related transcriptional regulator [Candidatus Methylomirabilis sp.]
MVDEHTRQHQALPEKSPLERLSAREREVLQLVVEGKTCADLSSLSSKTVETCRSCLTEQLGIRDLPGLIRYAIQHGLTSLKLGPLPLPPREIKESLLKYYPFLTDNIFGTGGKLPSETRDAQGTRSGDRALQIRVCADLEGFRLDETRPPRVLTEIVGDLPAGLVRTSNNNAKPMD